MKERGRGQENFYILNIEWDTVSFYGIEIPKKVFEGFDNVFYVKDSKNMKEIEFSWRLFELPAK